MSFTFGISETEIARQLADLLNKHNQLGQPRQSRDILNSPIAYVLEVQGKLLLGACGMDRQSYTFTEVKHLVVRPKSRRQGIARFLVRRVLAASNTPLVFASVRQDNQGSLKLFESLGFKPSIDYPSKDHKVVILTKVNEQWQKKSSGYIWSPVPAMLTAGDLGLPSE